MPAGQVAERKKISRQHKESPPKNHINSLKEMKNNKIIQLIRHKDLQGKRK